MRSTSWSKASTSRLAHSAEIFNILGVIKFSESDW